MRAFKRHLAVSLRRLVLQLRKMIHADVWAWRQEAHRCARADHFLTTPPNSKSYDPIFDFFFPEDAPILFGQVLKS